jgi:hypothetical protein
VERPRRKVRFARSIHRLIGMAGSKLHLAGDNGGLPLSVILTAANANDSTMLEAVLDIPLIRACPPGAVAADLPRFTPTRPMTIAVAGPICAGMHPLADRPAHGRVLGPVGPSSLDDRADRGLAGWLPAAADPL